MRLVSDIVFQDIISKFDLTLKVKSIGAEISGFQAVEFCNPKWARLYKKLLVDGNLIDVDSWVNDNTVKLVVGDIPFVGTESFEIFMPKYFNGTLSNTKWEWNKYVPQGDFQNKESNKLPFIWLVSPTLVRTDEYSQGGSQNAELNLWFVHWSDWQKLNNERQNSAVKPLQNMVDEFVRVTRGNVMFGDFSFTTSDYPKFGTEDATGITKAIFDSTLSAVQMDVTLKIVSTYCENC